MGRRFNTVLETYFISFWNINVSIIWSLKKTFISTNLYVVCTLIMQLDLSHYNLNDSYFSATLLTALLTKDKITIESKNTQ